MAKQENGYRANIGSSSLILIFIVMCLVTFGMLSLSAAKSDLNLAKRSADAVTGYYKADSDGEAFYKMVSDHVKSVCGQSADQAGRQGLLKAGLGSFYKESEGKAVTEVSMERAQALHIELSVDLSGAGTVDILQWRVISTEDYEIDKSMPVWTGTQENE